MILTNGFVETIFEFHPKRIMTLGRHSMEKQ